MSTTMIQNAKLLDAQYNYYQADVLVEGNMITAVGADCAGRNADNVIDLTGYTLMPGFFNAHLHLIMDEYVVTPDIFHKMVRNGVTAVRDMSALNDQPIDEVMELRATWCTENHPYVFTTCKTIATKGGYGDCTPDGKHVGINATTDEEAVKLVDQLVAAGADAIKIGIQAIQDEDPGIMPSSMVKKICERAHHYGTRVAAHVVKASFLQRLVSEGIDEAAHVPGDRMPDSLIEEMVKKNVILTATVTIYDHLSKFMGPQTITNAIDNVARFYRAGGMITVGTDCMPRPDTWQDFDMPMSELRYLSRAGMTPRDIVIAATKNSAVAAGADDLLGTITEGKLANLIAVPGELDDGMEIMGNVAFVMNRGVVVKQTIEMCKTLIC